MVSYLVSTQMGHSYAISFYLAAGAVDLPHTCEVLYLSQKCASRLTVALADAAEPRVYSAAHFDIETSFIAK